MNANILQALSSNSGLSAIPISLKPSTTATSQTQNLVSNIYRARSIRISAVNSTGSSSNNGGNDAQQPVPPTITPPDRVEIRFRRRSRRQKQQREDGINNKPPSKVQASANTRNTPKNWDDMNLTEKAIELYMGEKGLLFWLNKFAYASIFIVIGAWILFRFVGPSLNLYQLDAPPLSPSSIFKGS